jgi:hypothetical protein
MNTPIDQPTTEELNHDYKLWKEASAAMSLLDIMKSFAEYFQRFNAKDLPSIERLAPEAKALLKERIANASHELEKLRAAVDDLE